jgi:hypothetical protein
MKAKSDRQRRRYYALGPVKQLEKDLQELQRYRDLCGYERMADLLSRADILDHCDELNIK